MKLHLVRDVWTSDVTLVAQMLGNTVETVLQYYLELLRKQVEVADRFVRKAKQAITD